MFSVEKNTEKVSVFIESESIQKFSKYNNGLERLLQYRNEKHFQFIRSPLNFQESESLNYVDQFKILYQKDNRKHIGNIEIGDE
jgi:hypothetical protein